MVISDASGCVKETSVIIEGPYVYTVDDADILVPQSGGNNGAIDITLNGGSEGLTFTWTKDGVAYATTEDLNDLENGVYVLNISDNNGCTFGPYTYSLTPSGVYDASFTSMISVYPNPTSDIFTVKYEGKEDHMFYQIIDVLGRRVAMNLSLIHISEPTRPY